MVLRDKFLPGSDEFIHLGSIVSNASETDAAVSVEESVSAQQSNFHPPQLQKLMKKAPPP